MARSQWKWALYVTTSMQHHDSAHTIKINSLTENFPFPLQPLPTIRNPDFQPRAQHRLFSYAKQGK